MSSGGGGIINKSDVSRGWGLGEIMVGDRGEMAVLVVVGGASFCCNCCNCCCCSSANFSCFLLLVAFVVFLAFLAAVVVVVVVIVVLEL